MNVLFFYILFYLCFDCFKADYDKPCASYKEDGYESVVCVCNTTYCDYVSRETPTDGHYVAYTSSKAGLRFRKSYGRLEDYEEATNSSYYVHELEIDLKTVHQTIIGFGGAVTDAAGINWKNMTEELQKHMVNSYFGNAGLEYNMLRVPIGGTDFSTRPYAYNEVPENDIKLTNFSLAPEDYNYKIPLIQAAMQMSDTPIKVVATTWSPPPWMKTNNQWKGYSRLKEEFMQTYALYHIKFMEEYAAAGVPIWAITTTNEPLNGIINSAGFNSLGWTMTKMAQYIINNLGPALENSTFKDVKILVNDDQRVMIPYFFNLMVINHPETLKYIAGVAVHYYTDKFVPAALLSEVTKLYPDKFVLATEACEGSFPWEKRGVVLGSWTRANNYIVDILTDLNHNVVGWIDWNLCLNIHGGPTWASNFVDSTIIVQPEKGQFVKQPTFYAIGHFSKFIPRGSRRIGVEQKKSVFEESIDNVAFLTPYDTIVIVLYNPNAAGVVKIKLKDKQLVTNLAETSITTIEISK